MVLALYGLDFQASRIPTHSMRNQLSTLLLSPSGWYCSGDRTCVLVEMGELLLWVDTCQSLLCFQGKPIWWNYCHIKYVHLIGTPGVRWPFLFYFKQAQWKLWEITVPLWVSDSWESLGCEEIKPVSLKGNQHWIFIGTTDADDESPILWPPDVKS